MDPSRSQLEDGELHNENNFLNEISKNLPDKVCAAHSLMLLYIQDNKDNTNKRFDDLDKKIDPIVAYVIQTKIEKEAQDKVDEKEAKELDALEKKEVERENALNILFNRYQTHFELIAVFLALMAILLAAKWL